LDINKVIDHEKAIQNLGGEQLYQLMLPQYESSSLILILEKLAKEVNEQNWDQIKFQAHALKGPAGYIGASRLHYACYWI
jgi:HPt (histidine-containing phosphotransfer) domain-containing protein